MMNSTGANDSSNHGLNAILAEYLLSLESGKSMDRSRLLEAHPQFAAALLEFFRDHDQMMKHQDLSNTDPFGSQGNHPTFAAGLTSSDTSLAELPCDFGDYELLSEIDRGGMGVIYKARQASLGRIVALKMIKSGHLANEEEIARFHLEAEAAASLDHPAIVSIHEVGERQGVRFFSMQYIEGCTLSSRLAAGPMSPHEAAALVKKIALAVSYAHSSGVIHRDLKPANVLLDRDGEPHLADFGLAKRMTSNSKLTATGQILGTPAFMAPEQASGRDEEVNELVDVYAIGAILYMALTGKPPFDARNEIDLLLQVLDRDPRPPTKLNPNIPRPLELICLRCLEKKAERRYPSAEAVSQDLHRFLRDEPLLERTGDVSQSLRRWARREPALFAHITAILAFLAILQANFMLNGEDLSYHMQHATTMFVWLLLSFGLQQMLNQPRWANLTRFLWSTTDVALLTLILVMAYPPRGCLLIGYPVLIAASGMLARVRLVVFTTLASIVGYCVLIALRREESIEAHYHIFYLLGLAVVGCLVSAQVRRIRALSRYYEVEPTTLHVES